MTLFDFFQAEELPVPAVTPAQARDIAKTQFGVDAQIPRWAASRTPISC